MPGMQRGPPLLRKGDFPLAQRVAATGTEIFIEVLVRQNQQKTFPHRHRLGAPAAIESGGLERIKLVHDNESMKPDPTQVAQANNVVAASPEAISRAVELLRRGEVIGLPTETVYGLAGDGLNPDALARIFEVKQRPLFDPLILHFSDAEAAFAMAEEVPEMAHELARRFWPGPLTLVLKKDALVPDLATSGLPNVAVRVPAHPVAQSLLRAFGGPLAAPSANRFGRISPTDAQAVHTELGDAVPLVLDGGACTVGLESTVLSLAYDVPAPILLRAGGISLEQIQSVIGPVQKATPVDDRPQAPGQLKHHYAPRKPLRLVENVTEIPTQPDTGWLAFGKPPTLATFPGVIENISPGGDLREAAANFFRALRALDDHPRVATIYAVPLPTHGLGLAINERLERAAH
jgi:L-threonylcarbamoyladenylate synthase